jgi:pre-60S factor REI1
VQLAYSSESEKLEVSDYYDFSSSYAGPAPRRRKRRVDPKALDQVKEGEEWEDEEMADDEEVGSDVEVVEDDGYESDEMGSDYTDASLDDDHPDAPTFDPETFELVLPSGRRIGHRSLLPYYKQRPSQPRETSLDLVPVEKRTIAGRTDQALIPARGGFGDFGRGGEVVKARNKGEAKNAMKHPYREMQKREQFKTRVGYIANSQKHWRDHLRESACDVTFLLFCCPTNSLLTCPSFLRPYSAISGFDSARSLLLLYASSSLRRIPHDLPSHVPSVLAAPSGPPRLHPLRPVHHALAHAHALRSC